MDLKENWPLWAGGALLLIAVLVLLRSNSSGPGYSVGQTSTAGAEATAQAYLAAQAQQQQSVSGGLSKYLDYLANKDSIGAAEYMNYIQAQTQEFQISQQSALAQQYLGQQMQMFQQSQPSGWDKFFGDLVAAAKAWFSKGASLVGGSGSTNYAPAPYSSPYPSYTVA